MVVNELLKLVEGNCQKCLNSCAHSNRGSGTRRAEFVGGMGIWGNDEISFGDLHMSALRP